MDFIKMIKPDTRETAEVHVSREREYELMGFVRHVVEESPEVPKASKPGRKAKE